MTSFSEDPGIPYQARLTKPEFFAWLEQQEGGRFEPKDGHIVMHATPVLIVEVLSPSSAGRDMNVKLAEYTGLASLEAYIVTSQEEPMVWVWKRQGEARVFPELPAEIARRDAPIDLTSLGISPPLADIYRGVGG